MITLPRIWKHRKNGKCVRALPWWECVEPILSDKDVGKEMMEGRAFKIGAIVQIGWLLENEHRIWFGVGPEVEKEFKDMGEWKAKRRTRSTARDNAGEK